MASNETIPVAVWSYSAKYKDALIERATADKFWTCSFVGPTGPYFAAPDESGIISNAQHALKIAEQFPEQREWWIWVAGWYLDCPADVEQHFGKK